MDSSLPGWSHRSGRTRLAAATVVNPAQLVDRLLIVERIGRYGWCIDERRLDAMMSNFTEDVVWDGSIMGATAVGPFHGQADLRTFFDGILQLQTAQRRHAFTNVIVDVLESNTATAHAYLQLWSSEHGRTTPVSCGPYRFLFERVQDQWLISSVFAGWDSPLDWKS